MHWSLVVSKIPPSCLKAFLLKRKGVLPGTTSMANHNFLGVLSWRNKGIWIRYELVSDWLFPKRKVTLLGTCFTWELISGGKCWRSCSSTFSPMIHRLAPVSKMAWQGLSHEAAKHSWGKHSESFHCRKTRRAGWSAIHDRAFDLGTEQREERSCWSWHTWAKFGYLWTLFWRNWWMRSINLFWWDLSRSSRTTKASSQIRDVKTFGFSREDLWKSGNNLTPLMQGTQWSPSSGGVWTSSSASENTSIASLYASGTTKACWNESDASATVTTLALAALLESGGWFFIGHSAFQCPSWPQLRQCERAIRASKFSRSRALLPLPPRPRPLPNFDFPPPLMGQNPRPFFFSSNLARASTYEVIASHMQAPSQSLIPTWHPDLRWPPWPPKTLHQSHRQSLRR